MFNSKLFSNVFGNNGFGEGIVEDGEFARKNIQINVAGSQPVLQNIGDMILWELGGYYDKYDNSIDGTKWTSAVTGDFINVESNTTIKSYIDKAGGSSTGNGTSQLDTKLLVPTDIQEISIRAICKAEINNTNGSLKLFGWTLYSWTETFTVSDDSIWHGVKNLDGTWNIYDDGVLFKANWTPTNNQIQTSMSWVHGAFNTVKASIELYLINLNGSTKLLIQGSTHTFVLDLAGL